MHSQLKMIVLPVLCHKYHWYLSWSVQVFVYTETQKLPPEISAFTTAPSFPPVTVRPEKSHVLHKSV